MPSYVQYLSVWLQLSKAPESAVSCTYPKPSPDTLEISGEFCMYLKDCIFIVYSQSSALL